MASRPLHSSRRAKSTPDDDDNNKAGHGIVQQPVRLAPTRQVASRHPSTRIKSTGTKRARAGGPRIPAHTCDSSSARSYITPSFSEEEWHDCSSSNGGSTDSGPDIEHGATHKYTLPTDHKFQRQRSELLRFSFDTFKEWTVSARYAALPRKRSRKSGWQAESPCLEETEDHSDTEFIILGHPKPFHLACPCYVFDPVKYRQCLLQYDQQSIEGLIGHIRFHHMKPFYCPICFETFDTVIHRDDHILENACELREPKPIEGIYQNQMARLMRRDKRYLDDTKRWRRIWTAIFPNSKPPCSPYLDQGCGLAVSMARDFWKMHGRRCVLEFLESRTLLGEHQEDDEGARDALCRLALRDLLNEIIDKHSSTREHWICYGGLEKG